MVGLVVGQPVDEHLQLDHVQRGVVEHDDFHRQPVQRNGEQLAHQHAQTTVTGHRDHLPARVAELGTDRVRQRVGHRPMHKRTDHPPAAIGGEVAGRPDVAHAGVDGEHGIIAGEFIEDPRGVFGMDRDAMLDIVGIGVDHVLECLFVPMHNCLATVGVLTACIPRPIDSPTRTALRSRFPRGIPTSSRQRLVLTGILRFALTGSCGIDRKLDDQAGALAGAAVQDQCSAGGFDAVVEADEVAAAGGVCSADTTVVVGGRCVVPATKQSA